MRTAVLAAVILKDQKQKYESVIEECRQLCIACDTKPAATVTQLSRSVDPNTVFRSGKLQELAEAVRAVNADVVVFCNPLSFSAGNRIAEACGTAVIDRTALILDIFSMRARTAQAKIQVESARLQYALGRVYDADEEETHQRAGGYRNRGAGEMRSSVIRRKYQNRISSLKKQLREIQKQNRTAEIRRTKSALGRAALVGYTNSGKSSVMNALLKMADRNDSTVLEKDMLFATLDTSVRSLSFEGKSFLLYDTVGFVSDLPGELIDAFDSTLDAARDADLLIHVIDASDSGWQKKADDTTETLKRIGAGNIPVLRVFNKMDLTENREQFEGICISALKGEGLENLLRRITEMLYPEEEVIQCLIPYDKISEVQPYRSTVRMTVREECENGIRMEVAGQAVRLIPFHKYSERKSNGENSLGKV